MQRLGVVVGDERQQVGRRKHRAQALQVVTHVDRRRGAVVHPRDVGEAEHADVEAVAAARHVLDQQIRIAIAQLRQHVVERAGVREVAVGRAVAVALPIAVDEHVVVPLQVVGLDLVDERGQAIHQPLPRRGVGEADLAGVIGSVLSALGREPRLLDARRADERQVDALWLDPEAEPQPEAVRVVAQRRETVGETRGIRGPTAQAGVEVERTRGAGAGIPAGVDRRTARRRAPRRVPSRRASMPRRSRCRTRTRCCR